MYNMFHVFEGHNIVWSIRFTFLIISGIVDYSLFLWKTWSFKLNMPKIFAFKTLDPVEIYTTYSLMLKVKPLEIVLLIVLNIYRDIILRSHIYFSHNFTKDLSKPGIFSSIIIYLVFTIFIIYFKFVLRRILNIIKNIGLMNCLSFEFPIFNKIRTLEHTQTEQYVYSDANWNFVLRMTYVGPDP